MTVPSQTADKGRRRRQPRHKAAPSKFAPPADDGTVEENSCDNKSLATNQAPDSNSALQPSESVLARQIRQSGDSTPPRHGDSDQNTSDANIQNIQKSSRKKVAHLNDTYMGTPGSKRPSRGQQAGASTPSKPAVEAYAGPTFHASPAPSALPIPKFFSKSAPSNNDQDVGIKSRLQQDDGSSSSGGEDSPESPSRQPSARAPITGNKTAPTPALFNMLINADREEKARQRAGQGPESFHNSAGNTALHSPPASAQRPGHHRTLTAGSIFPIDLDASSGRSTPAASTDRGKTSPERDLPIPAYSGGGQRPYSSTESDSLKRMLFSSPSQTAPSGSSQQHLYGSPMPQSPPAWASSPASRTYTSSYGTPSPASSAHGLATSSRPAPISPYTQASPSPAVRRPMPSLVQNSSGLRRQVSPSQPSSQGSPPHLSAYSGPEGRYAAASSPLGSPVSQNRPTSGGYSFNHPSYGNFGHMSPSRTHSPSSGYHANKNARFNASDALKASLGQSQAMGGLNMAGMEDELRRVLRIGDLRATSATAPPS